jgi:hypothetical protein
MESGDSVRNGRSLQMDTYGQIKVANTQKPCFLSFCASTILPFWPST